MERLTSVEKKMIRYSPTNEPTSLEEAELRLYHQECTGERIRTQIEYFLLTDYEDEDDYYAWRQDAISALSHTRGEIAYIVRWISRNTFDVNTPTVRPIGVAKPADTNIEDISSKASKSAEDFLKNNESCFSDSGDLVYKVTDLSKLRRRVELEIMTLNSNWKKLNLPPQDRSQALKPLSDLKAKILTKTDRVKELIRNRMTDGQVS